MVRYAITLFLIAVGGTVAFAGPLHEAALSGDAELVFALIDGGADLDAQAENGETPLIILPASPVDGACVSADFESDSGLRRRTYEVLEASGCVDECVRESPCAFRCDK